MRKIILQEFITLDGVMQAPGGSKEDEAEGFKYGGWTAPFADVAFTEAAEFMKQWMESTDILLGQKTFEIFAGYWPKHADAWPGINVVTKYVASTTMTQSNVDASGWDNSVLLNNVDDIIKLKDTDGDKIKVHGSGNLAQTLLKHDLVDEMFLMTFPITLGTGKRLFGEGTIPAAFKMTDSLITSNGVTFAYFKRDGEVKTGNIGEL
jgi:dihydrofolate reductase